MMKLSFNKTDILQYKERKKLPSSRDEKIQKIREIKTHFFAFPGKTNGFEQRAEAITKLALERIRSHTLDVGAYKKELKTELQKITHAVYQNEYMYDKERNKIAEIFELFLGGVKSTPAERLNDLKKQLEEKDPKTPANQAKTEEIRAALQSHIKNLEIKIGSFDANTIETAIKTLQLKESLLSAEKLSDMANEAEVKEFHSHRSHEYAETARIAKNNVDLLKKELEELNKENNVQSVIEYFNEINKTTQKINNLSFQSPAQRQELRRIRLEIAKIDS